MEILFFPVLFLFLFPEALPSFGFRVALLVDLISENKQSQVLLIIILARATFSET